MDIISFSSGAAGRFMVPLTVMRRPSEKFAVLERMGLEIKVKLCSQHLHLKEEEQLKLSLWLFFDNTTQSGGFTSNKEIKTQKFKKIFLRI